MSRTTRVTLTASAVTLLCLGASLSASPQVIAETLGREVQTFSPLDPSTYPGNTQQEPAQALDASAAPRQQSTMTADGTWNTSTTTDGAGTAILETEGPLFRTADAATPQPSHNEPTEPAQDPTPQDRSASSDESPSTDAEIDDAPDHSARDDSAPNTGGTAEADVPDEPTAPDLDSPDSLTVIVNKLRPLPEDFVPEDLVALPADFGDESYELRAAAADAVQELFAAAQEDGIELTVVSAYRSYEYQHELYQSYSSQHGAERTNEMSAKPGHSEHQTGLALDIDIPDGADTLQQSFGQTEAGQWLAEHAHDYGFVVRYPQDAQQLTGFHYEPWHLRFFGVDHAAEIMDGSGVAETEFGLDPAPDYES